MQSRNTYETTIGYVRYSTSTGKRTRVFGVFQFRGQVSGDFSLFWTDSTGNTVIGGGLTPSGIRVGVISGKKFTPLPGTTGLRAAAW